MAAGQIIQTIKEEALFLAEKSDQEEALNTIRDFDNRQHCRIYLFGTKTALATFAEYSTYALLVPSLILIVILIFLNRRKRLCVSCCGARPGPAVPIYFLNDNVDRGALVASFGMGLTLLSNLLFAVVVIVSALMVGVIIYPLLAVISTRKLLGYIVGVIYVWLITIVFFLQQLPCRLEQSDVFALPTLVVANLPLIVCATYLSVLLPYRIYQKCCLPKNTVQGALLRMIEKSEYPPFQLAHVQRLFKCRRSVGAVNQNSRMFKDEKGFRLSIHVLLAICMTIIICYNLSILTLRQAILRPRDTFELIASFAQVAIAVSEKQTALQQQQYESYTDDDVEEPDASEPEDVSSVSRLQRQLNLNLNETEHVVEAEILGNPFLREIVLAVIDIMPLGYPRYVLSEVPFWQTSIITVITVSVIVSFLLNTLSMLHSLRRYRHHMLNLYAGRFKAIPRYARSWAPEQILSMSARYVGYQIAFGVWGFFLQMIFIAVVSCLGYIFVAATIRYDLLGVCRALYNYEYCVIFANLPLGALSSLMRTIKSALFGLVLLPRLDMSTMARQFENMDAGFAAYVCMLAVENAHTNPVVVVFAYFIQEYRHKNRAQNLRKILVRNRWHLFVTLINNPMLRYARIHDLQWTQQFLSPASFFFAKTAEKLQQQNGTGQKQSEESGPGEKKEDGKWLDFNTRCSTNEHFVTTIEKI